MPPRMLPANEPAKPPAPGPPAKPPMAPPIEEPGPPPNRIGNAPPIVAAARRLLRPALAIRSVRPNSFFLP